VSVGGDHGVTGTYASAAGVVPRVADSLMPESAPHGIDHNVRAAPVPDSGNGDAGLQELPPRAPAQRRRGEAGDAGGTRRRPLVPSARAVDDGVGALAVRATGIDDPEFRDYVRSRSRALLRTAYLLTGNMADAEDLLQSALAKTYLAWDRIEDRGALDGYVRRALVNTHISWWRRRRLEEYPTDEIPDQAVVDHSVSSELQESLRRAIDRLPQRMRAAVMLRYYDDMTEAEVADVLGVSLGTVKSTVSRAVAKLRIDAELQPE
jgi:RNA polymerase sigma-70 factor (sigma-E family)